MVLKIVKIVGISLGALFLLLFGIAFSKVDKNSTSKIKDAFAGLFGKKKSESSGQPLTGNIGTKNGVIIPTFSKVVEPVVTTTKYAEKLGLTYEGQALYRKYDGTDGSKSPNIGYLIDGTLIGLHNAEYKEGEYKKKIVPDSGVILSSFINSFIVDGISQRVYAQKSGVNLWNEIGAIGFLDSGIIVYKRIVNEGQTNEYSFYGT